MVRPLGPLWGSSEPDKQVVQEGYITWKVRDEDTIITEEIGFVGGDSITVSYSVLNSNQSYGELRDFEGNIVAEIEPSKVTYRREIEKTNVAYWKHKGKWYEMVQVPKKLEELRASARCTDVEYVRSQEKTHYR